MFVPLLAFGLCRMEELPTFCEVSPLPLSLLVSVPSCTFCGLAFPLPPSPFPFAGLAFPLPPRPLPLDPSPEVSVELLAEYNGQKFNYNDLVDVIMGTGPGVVGKKCEPIKAKFKGVVETVRGTEFLCRPLVGSSRGPCPQYPRHSVFRLRAFGSCVLGTTETRFFSKFRPAMQELL